MLEMCHMAGNRDQLITLLLQLAERVLNILLIHFRDEYDSLFYLNLHSRKKEVFDYGLLLPGRA